MLGLGGATGFNDTNSQTGVTEEEHQRKSGGTRDVCCLRQVRSITLRTVKFKDFDTLQPNKRILGRYGPWAGMDPGTLARKLWF